jgi:hypothetical protein
MFCMAFDRHSLVEGRLQRSVPAPASLLSCRLDHARSRCGARPADLGQEIFSLDRQTPEALGAFQRAEIEKWWPIIKAANIRGE